MSYTTVFGGSTIYPSDVSYIALTLSTDITLEWPLENGGGIPAARIIDITAPTAHVVKLPDATRTAPGQTILVNNLSGSAASVTINNAAGATIATVAPGEQWELYLADNTTTGGVWRVFRFGASTATVQPSSLIGYGMVVTSGQLSQALPVTTFNSTRTLLTSDRASILVWNGTGAGTLNLLGVVSAGNNFFASVRNSGGGILTIDAAGSEVIDGATTLQLQPGESATIVTNGLEWFSLGKGQDATFAFDYTSINVGGAASPYVLSGSQLNRVAYSFIGALTHDITITVPPTIQQYWVDNSTTGSYNLFLNTASGVAVKVPQGSRGIYYCNGSNVVNAATAGVSLPVLVPDGGTGQVSYSVGDLLTADTTTTLSKLSDVATGNVLLSGGVGVVPAWGKVGLTTHITGTLAPGNGGTGLTALATNGQLLIGTGTGFALATLSTGTGIGVVNASGTITISNSLPMVYPGAGIAVSTGSAWGTSLTAPTGTIVGTTDAQTLTSKRIDPRVSSTASTATLAPDISANDMYVVSALAVNMSISAPIGTPVVGDKLMIRIKDNGTSRTLSWNAAYRVVGVVLPTATTANKTVYVGCVYNATDAVWDVIAVATQV